ncbi:MAG: DUF2812 domain-containing protein [Eubacterium sp.]|nr:DUF2812 domain-containing protein [Eubacterium sp.]
MIRFRLYFDKDAETRWLNDMAEQGWAMKSFFAGFYSFERCEPGQYMYQVDFGNRFFSVSEEYREFMQETGVEIVQPWGFWIILRKKAGEGAFELYTDVDSTIEHYTKIRRMFKAVAVVEILCLFLELYSGYSGFSVGFVFSFMILAFLLAFFNIINKTSNIIDQLQERKGITTAVKKKGVSPFLLGGLLLIAFALMMNGNVNPAIHHLVQIAAIIFMVVGIYRTARQR